MEVQIKAKDFKVTEGLRTFVQVRADKLDRFIGRVTDAKLELTHEHPRSGGPRIIAQLTIAVRHTILRAEEQHADAERAVDLAYTKMLGQIRRYHSKRIDRSRRPSIADFVALPDLAAADLAELEVEVEEEAGTDGREIVRTKQFALKPMTSGEAIDQLELLGHDFFVFRNADDDLVSVVYRRKGGDYGLIQPQ